MSDMPTGRRCNSTPRRAPPAPPVLALTSQTRAATLRPRCRPAATLAAAPSPRRPPRPPPTEPRCTKGQTAAAETTGRAAPRTRSRQPRRTCHAAAPTPRFRRRPGRGRQRKRSRGSRQWRPSASPSQPPRAATRRPPDRRPARIGRWNLPAPASPLARPERAKRELKCKAPPTRTPARRGPGTARVTRPKRRPPGQRSRERCKSWRAPACVARPRSR
mmetsp:Transcript_32441/g.103830  ORF Transcript_32441/g.103830 Transcript_32441/m.103830 type:complete len:218 (-) Transcript_32441:370-1023(-)